MVLTVVEQSIHFLSRPHEGAVTVPVSSRAAWYGKDLRQRTDWQYRLGEKEIAEFEQAMLNARQAGRSLDDLDARDFPLPHLETVIAQWKAALVDGYGFQLVKGVPVSRWSLEESRLFMRCVGVHLGHLGMQNARGDVIGDVSDTGADKRDPFARNYLTSREFRFHCDAADVVGLLCIRPAQSGGRSRISSSVTVFNEILGKRPDLAQRLFEPVLLDLRNEQQSGAAAYGSVTPCAFAGGRLKTFYISDYFHSVDRHPDAPFSDADRELLTLYDNTAASPDLMLEFDCEPGDLQILYNHTVLHSRTAFVDNPDAKRLLLRFLVSLDR